MSSTPIQYKEDLNILITSGIICNKCINNLFGKNWSQLWTQMQWPYESLLFWDSPADFGAHLVLIHDSWTIAYSPDKPFVIQPSIIPSSKKARKDRVIPI